MLNDVCLYLRNFFVEKIYKGSFTIKNGVLAPLDFLADGQFYRLVGSKFNDGVYKAGDGTLTDEVFDGAVWAMAVPPSVIALSAQIDDYEAKTQAALASPYISESYPNGYSYTKGTKSESGGFISAFDVYASKLAPYRKIMLDVSDVEVVNL